MHLRLRRSIVRSWTTEDLASLVKYADNRKIWLNLRDLFPHPYTLEHAQEWLVRCSATSGPPHNLAIEHAGEAIGSVGLSPMTDVARFTAELGYWLGEPFWGRGLATEALRRFTEYAFESFSFERLEAWIFASNPASGRVLEKAGYEREATLKSSAFKEGRFLDCHVYARLRPR